MERLSVVDMKHRAGILASAARIDESTLPGAAWSTPTPARAASAWRGNMSFAQIEWDRQAAS